MGFTDKDYQGGVITICVDPTWSGWEEYPTMYLLVDLTGSYMDNSMSSYTSGKNI